MRFKALGVVAAAQNWQAVSGGAVSSNFGSNVDCARSTLNPGFTRGCLAPTVRVGNESICVVAGRLRLNGVDDWYYDTQFYVP
ncbi:MULTISPECIES: hypothetical protein [Streptomyces]|uniref:Uncharacterized protein n=1 Tax=Streptomyces chartreusis NRRL 3882 TaxID=1079985 RepID=A0A2N9B4F1_STRCX|nr:MULTISPECIES: hypothetical protein [Streptomyces]MYS95659.1 hypothetical protein [Streptomyces sp. SID5464]SOR78198.1 hypothetical protein SCNRRL3882_1666 [Streptomyces chartreusis NRRL 3882]